MNIRDRDCLYSEGDRIEHIFFIYDGVIELHSDINRVLEKNSEYQGLLKKLLQDDAENED